MARGDNDPAATDHLKAVAAAVDVLVPRIERPASGEAMCAGWGYQRPAKREQTVVLLRGDGSVVHEYAVPHPGHQLDAAGDGLARLAHRRPASDYR